jgi:SAM-dependent methyltransferase
VVIPEAAWPYLVAQRGRLDHLRTDRSAWRAAYGAELQAQFDEIAPYLPSSCGSFLDVGGGVGGMALMLARRYPDALPAILDGADADPRVIAHNRPFNHFGASDEFLRANGVENWAPVSTENPEPLACDLIVSFAAWCFHIEPDRYLDFVRACCRPGTVLILEVRKARMDWQAQLRAAFDFVAGAGESEKSLRVVYVAR